MLCFLECFERYLHDTTVVICTIFSTLLSFLLAVRCLEVVLSIAESGG